MKNAIDYRCSAWSLGDALAGDDALARLEARPVAPENRAALAAGHFAIDPRAERKTGDALVVAGFRYLGTLIESASYVRRRLDVFVDPDATTYVTVRRVRSLIGLSRYYVLTSFDDGTSIETVALEKPLYASEGPLTVRAGRGDDLAGDVARHLDAVRERARGGPRVVRVRDLDTVLRLSKHFVGHVLPTWLAARIARTRATERQLAGIAGVVLAIAAMVVSSHF